MDKPNKNKALEQYFVSGETSMEKREYITGSAQENVINEEEEDNSKYVMSDKDENNLNKILKEGKDPKSLSIQGLETINSGNQIENMPLQINNEELYKFNNNNGNGNINNMIINSSRSEHSKNSEDNSIDNYIKMENLYLQDGKCNTTNSNLNNQELFKERVMNDPKRHMDFLARNEEKLKFLQKEMQKNLNESNNEENEILEENPMSNQINISAEGQNIINNNENEIESINEQFEVEEEVQQKSSNETPNLTAQNVNITNTNTNTNLPEPGTPNEWSPSNNYDLMCAEYKQTLRNERENKLKEQLREKLKPKIIKEIYNKEYNFIAQEIKKEIEVELGEELTKKNIEEINFAKKRQMYLQKVKEEEAEKEVRQKCQEELEEDLKRELNLKEKELKLRYMQRFEAYKKKLEKELNEDYIKKKNQMTKEIDEIKSQIYRSKCSENLKVNKINAMKRNINQYHEKNMKDAQQVEKIMNSQENNQTNENYLTNNTNTNDFPIPGTNPNMPPDNDYQFEGDGLAQIYQKLAKEKATPTLGSGEKSKSFISNKVNNSVNIAEINKKMKSQNEELINKSMAVKASRQINKGEPGNINISQSFNQKPKQRLKNDPSVESKDPKKNPQPQKQVDQMETQTTQQGGPVQFNNRVIVKNNGLDQSHTFYSIQLDQSIPTTVSEFGKYLIAHIEKEENYRILFQSEIRKIKMGIKRIFSAEKSTDHCLTDYMLELWEKLEISFITRYQILKQMLKLKALELYSFLDRETEYLTEYYQISEEIFKMIKQRESIKLKLQTKLNRNEILPDDRNGLDEITKDIEERIKNFKITYKNLDIVWKGIRYEWFMNYENWFYEMEMKKN